MKNILFFILLSTISASSLAQDKEVWVDCIIGKPDMRYLEIKDSLCKNLGINYEYKTYGCEVTDDILAECKKIEQGNEAYFKKLEARLGENWRQKLQKQIEKARKS